MRPKGKDEKQCVTNGKARCHIYEWSTYVYLKPNTYARIRISVCSKDQKEKVTTEKGVVNINSSHIFCRSHASMQDKDKFKLKRKRNGTC